MIWLPTTLFLFTLFVSVYSIIDSRRKGPTIQALSKDVHRLIYEYETEKRKAAEYFSKIEEVIAEREQWRVLYNDQAGGHDNAQALMLETITKLVHLYRRDTGKTPVLDPLIERVRGDWVSVHGPEVREKLGDNGRPISEDEKKPS